MLLFYTHDTGEGLGTVACDINLIHFFDLDIFKTEKGTEFCYSQIKVASLFIQICQSLSPLRLRIQLEVMPWPQPLRPTAAFNLCRPCVGQKS